MIKLSILTLGYLTLSWADVRTKSVSVIHIVLVTLVWLLTSVLCNDLVVEDCLLGIGIGIILCVTLTLSNFMGIADGLLLVITGGVAGAIILMKIFIIAVTLLSFFAIILGVVNFVKRQKINIKMQIPFIPFLFLASLGVTICG